MSGIGRRIVVIGGSGMLGTAVVRDLTLRGRDHVAPRRGKLDLERAGSLETALAALAPSAVINAAAFTDVAGAEREEHRSRVDRLNRDSPGELAAACRRLGVPLVHVSTDYVFDGRKRTPYGEDDPVSPLQAYGRSKLQGERIVLDSHDGALVARTSTLYGPGRRERPHYVDAVLRRARATGRLELVRLPVSSPTHAEDLARALIDLVDAGAVGVVHVVNRGGCSRIELAEEALRLSGLAGSVELLERPEPAGSLRRPDYSVLDTSRFTALTGRPMRAWQEALREYLR